MFSLYFVYILKYNHKSPPFLKKKIIHIKNLSDTNLTSSLGWFSPLSHLNSVWHSISSYLNCRNGTARLGYLPKGLFDSEKYASCKGSMQTQRVQGFLSEHVNCTDELHLLTACTSLHTTGSNLCWGVSCLGEKTHS